jgi:hypothetical protein
VISPDASLVASRLPSRLKTAWRAGADAGQVAASAASRRGPLAAGLGCGDPQAARTNESAKIRLERIDYSEADA